MFDFVRLVSRGPEVFGSSEPMQIDCTQEFDVTIEHSLPVDVGHHVDPTPIYQSRVSE